MGAGRLSVRVTAVSRNGPPFFAIVRRVLFSWRILRKATRLHRPPQRGRRSRHCAPLAARQRPPRVRPPRGGARTRPEASAARRPRRGRCGLRHGHAPERQRRPPQQDSSPGRWRVLVPRRHEGLLAALLGNIRRVSALLKEARGHVWRHQPRAIRAKAGAGAATGALRDSAAGLLGTDEARDPDDGASSLERRWRGRDEEERRPRSVPSIQRRRDGRRPARNRGTSRRRPLTNSELQKQVNINMAIKKHSTSLY